MYFVSFRISVSILECCYDSYPKVFYLTRQCLSRADVRFSFVQITSDARGCSFFFRPDYFSGYPTFVLSILGVGLVTAVIGDIASHVGCCIGLKDSITAICIVALGTSVPGKREAGLN